MGFFDGESHSYAVKDGFANEQSAVASEDRGALADIINACGLLHKFGRGKFADCLIKLPCAVKTQRELMGGAKIDKPLLIFLQVYCADLADCQRVATAGLHKLLVGFLQRLGGDALFAADSEG